MQPIKSFDDMMNKTFFINKKQLSDAMESLDLHTFNSTSQGKLLTQMNFVKHRVVNIQIGG